MTKNIVWQFICKYYADRKLSLLLIVLTLSLNAVCSTVAPWYYSKIFNFVQNQNPTIEIWHNILHLFIIGACLSISAPLLTSASVILLQLKIFSPLSKNIQQDLFIKALSKHQKFWHQNDAGSIWGKITSSRRRIGAYSSLGDILISGYCSFCKLAIILILIFQINISLGLIYICAYFTLACLFYKLSANQNHAGLQVYILRQKIFAKLVNMINNHMIIKIFGTLNRETELLQKGVLHSAKARQKSMLIKIKNENWLNLAMLIFVISVICYSVHLWSLHQINVGHIIYIVTSITSTGNYISTNIELIMHHRSEFYNLQKDLKCIDTKNEIVDIPHAKPLRISRGKIEFKHLKFSFSNKINLFTDFNLTIPAGQKVGIVGVSGGGKTTLLYLLQRLFNTPAGSIFIDGQDITKVTQESLHSAIGFIPQDTTLFHRSIAKNLKYGRLNADYNHLQQASKAAYVDEFVKNFPQKYNTLVGDKGVKLSGGQRQRIGIARAFLKDSPILLLDEVTSALDGKSEQYIQKSLKKIIRNKTVLIVAHRLSTLQNMDRIIVLDKGRIIEDDSPQNLLHNQGKFAELWNLQS